MIIGFLASLVKHGPRRRSPRRAPESDLVDTNGVNKTTTTCKEGRAGV
jgi:hypothetical protein